MVKSSNGQKLIRNIPIENILIETDTPFVGNIKTVGDLEINIKSTLYELERFYGNDVGIHINNTSKLLFEV